MDRELHAVLMPDGDIQLEWAPLEGRLQGIHKSRQLVEKEIFRRFGEDKAFAFLFLGFSDKSVPLSDSLGFWRAFAGLFAKKISLTPDLEQCRQSIAVYLSREEAAAMLDSAPLMAGSEYLSTGLLEDMWKGLGRCFTSGIKHYKGTVEEFIRSYSPDVHLVGRVYFLLVENKNDNAPFAFLATYSAGLPAQGQGTSRHLPLKYALEEFGQDNEKLLDLLSTVHLAAKDSPFDWRTSGIGGGISPSCDDLARGVHFFKRDPAL